MRDVKVVKKDQERQRDVDADLQRLDLSRLNLLIEKYTEHARQKLEEIQMRPAVQNSR